ncbi:CASP-like protein 1 [Actinidia eriantha]|uniref:CASP-like protein 1 n=1 Tax=Actinidia eriantha TaxID=165200 RepID=UPI0025876B36|nr:CASP-like protein 1 [Actinidia eriantha]
MASTTDDKPAPELEKAAPEPEKAVPLPEGPPQDRFVVVDVFLRLLLCACSVVAVVVMVTSKQTKMLGRLPVAPFSPVFKQAKFNHSPALIYFVAALSVAGLYSLITAAVSFLALLKPGCSTKMVAHIVIFDVLVLGIVAAAAGTAGGVAYIGYKGNSHVMWNKVCNVYDKFCHHVAASLGVSLVASVVLVLLVILSVYSLSKKIPK